MTRRISFTARQYAEGEGTGPFPIVLIEIDHPELDAPLRFSTDPTEELSSDPYVRGTRSTWRGANPETEPFTFVAASAEFPAEIEEQGPEVRLIIFGITSEVVYALRDVTSPATCSIAKVMSSDPDDADEEVLDLELANIESDMGSLSLFLTQVQAWLEEFPATVISATNFPALYK